MKTNCFAKYLLIFHGCKSPFCKPVYSWTMTGLTFKTVLHIKQLLYTHGNQLITELPQQTLGNLDISLECYKATVSRQNMITCQWQNCGKQLRSCIKATHFEYVNYIAHSEIPVLMDKLGYMYTMWIISQKTEAHSITNKTTYKSEGNTKWILYINIYISESIKNEPRHKQQYNEQIMNPLCTGTYNKIVFTSVACFQNCTEIWNTCGKGFIQLHNQQIPST